MLKSMTGFGRGQYEDENFSVTVEMKTVNHRYNEVAIRLPRFLNPLEDKIRKTICKFRQLRYFHSNNHTFL